MSFTELNTLPGLENRNIDFGIFISATDELDFEKAILITCCASDPLIV